MRHTTRRFLFFFLLLSLIITPFAHPLSSVQAITQHAAPTLTAFATTITVTTTEDFNTSGSETCADVQAHECSLRRAVVEARGATKPVQIAFNIPVTDTGYIADEHIWKIAFSGSDSALRRLNGEISIDGTTQNANQSEARPAAEGPSIFIVGTPGSTQFENIVADGDNNEFLGLGFQFVSIVLNGSSNRVADNWFGLDDDGTDMVFPSDDPQRENNATLRDASASSGNIISDNVFAGMRSVAITIEGDNVTVSNNYIGTRADGTIPDVPEHRRCRANARFNNWFGGGKGIRVVGDNGTITGNYLLGLSLSSDSLKSDPPPAMEIDGKDNVVQNNTIGRDTTGADAWTCGVGFVLGGEGHDILNNTIVNAELGAVGIYGGSTDLGDGSITIQTNTFKDTPQAIFFGDTVPSKYANFNPAKITAINGTTVTGTAGDDGVTKSNQTFSCACPNCTIELFADNTDDYEEALEPVGITTADANGDWTATLSRTLQAGEALRTTSTTAARDQIEGLNAGTTTKLSVLYDASGVVTPTTRAVATPGQPPTFEELQPKPPVLELENESAPETPILTYNTIITVTSTDDPNTSKSETCYTTPGVGQSTVPTCTLRRAFVEASSVISENRPVLISFNIPTTDTGYLSDLNAWKINLIDDPNNALERMTGGYVTLDGTTQRDYGAETRADGPPIIIEGQNTQNIMIFDDDDNIVRGLALQGFSLVFNGSSNFIEQNWLGLHNDGQTIYFPNDDPTQANDASIEAKTTTSISNVIRSNVIAGARDAAISLGGTGGWIVGNFIGTRSDGTVPDAPDSTRPCDNSPGSGNWFGGYGIQVSGAHIHIGGANAADRNYIAGLLTASNDPESTPPDAIRVNSTGDTLIMNNLVGIDTSGKEVGTCGEGVNISASYTRVYSNEIASTGTNAIILNTAIETGNSDWYESNILRNVASAIVFGQNVPDDLKLFNPAKVTTFAGTTVSGTSGDPGERPNLPPIDSTCPYCIVEIFLDDTDEVVEALEPLVTTTADGDGNWQVVLPRALNADEGIRTISTSGDYNTIDNYEIGTSTKLSRLYTEGGVRAVKIDGPTTGEIGTTYTYTATITNPSAPTTPITYTWDTFGDGAPAESVIENAATSVYTFNWDSIGTKTIELEANNIGGEATAVYTVEIKAKEPEPEPEPEPVVAIEALNINGPETGTIGETYIFTATVTKPTSPTLPITYTWNGDDHDETTMISGTLSSHRFTWNTTGTKVINVHANNAGNNLVISTTIEIGIADDGEQPSPIVAKLSGPNSGSIGETYIFTATVTQPTSPTLPITYTWKADDQQSRTEVISDILLSQRFTWATTGTKVIAVHVSNADGSGMITKTIAIEAGKEEPEPEPEPEPKPKPGEGTITTDGGVITSTDGVTLTFPSGSFAGDTRITYEYRLQATAPVTSVKKFTISAEDANGAVDQSAQEYTITLPFTPEEVAEIKLGQLELYTWDEATNEWVKVPGSSITVVDDTTIRITLSTFGQFVLIPLALGTPLEGELIYLPVVMRM